MGYYERDGFDPTIANNDHPFDERHSEYLQNIGVHVIDRTKLFQRADRTTVTLVNDEFDPAKSDALSVFATLKGDKNLRGEPAHIYDGEIKLRSPSGLTIDSFISTLDTGFRGHMTDQFIGSSVFRILTDRVFDVGIYRGDDALQVSNEFTLTNGQREHRLVAPEKTSVNAVDQLQDYLSALLCATYTAHNIYHFRRRPFYISPLVLTPDGPLYRNPETGEYRHRLGRQSIDIKGNRSHNLETSKKSPMLDDLYGIEHIKEKLDPLILYFEHPEVIEKWGAERPNGVFLTGPAGTGKTTIIEALANELGGELFTVKGSEIHDKYLGDSQKMITSVFDKVRNAKVPTILFFDEFEGLISTTDETDSGSSAVNAVAAIFKTEVARIAKENPNVVLAAATNYPDRVDPTLIRAGRFDLKIEVNLPNQQARQRIFGNLILSAAAPDQDTVLEALPSDNSERTNIGSAFRRFNPELLGAESHEHLAKITEDFSIADILNVLRRATLQKATDEVKGKPVGPISLEDLTRVISVYHHG